MIFSDWAAFWKPWREWIATELAATRAEMAATRAESAAMRTQMVESNRLLKLSYECQTACKKQSEQMIKLLTAIEANTGKKNK